MVDTSSKPHFSGQLRLAVEDNDFEAAVSGRREDLFALRTVIHTDRRLHQASANNPTGETVYIDGPYSPDAKTGESVRSASTVAEALRPYALLHGHALLGVRILASQTDPYLSKIVFFRRPNADMNDILGAIAKALEFEFADISALKFDTVRREPVSESELKDRYEQISEDMRMNDLYR